MVFKTSVSGARKQGQINDQRKRVTGLKIYYVKKENRGAGYFFMGDCYDYFSIT